LLGREGMEVTLTIPLILLLCWYRLRRGFTWTISSAVLYGLLAAMVVLSRLDAVLFVALLFLLECFCNRPISARGWLLRLAALVGGSIPIGLYVLSNRYFFNTLTPISGQAKQLRLHHALSLDPAESLFHYYSSTVILFSGLLAIALAILAVLLHGRRLASKDHLAVVLSLFLFPFLQLLAVSYMSDWPLWSWYSYPFVALTAGALLVGFGCRPASYTYGSPLARRGVFVAAIFAMVAFAFAVGFRTSWQAKTIGYYNYANDLVEFSETHRGVYAMGDAAGTAAYLLHDPFIQLEGLVMDKPYLDNIRQQRDLKQVLASYNVRYYVTPASKLVDGCYQTVEPAQSGPGSPKMRGTFCMTPVARFDHGGHPLAIFDLQAN